MANGRRLGLFVSLLGVFAAHPLPHQLLDPFLHVEGELRFDFLFQAPAVRDPVGAPLGPTLPGATLQRAHGACSALITRLTASV